jgi:hypothetical protein
MECERFIVLTGDAAFESTLFIRIFNKLDARRIHYLTIRAETIG